MFSRKETAFISCRNTIRTALDSVTRKYHNANRHSWDSWKTQAVRVLKWWWEVNVDVSLLTISKSKTLTVAGEPELGWKCSVSAQVMLAGIHASSGMPVMVPYLPCLTTHEYTSLDYRSKKGSKHKWFSPFTWHSLDHVRSTASTFVPSSTREVPINCCEFSGQPPRQVGREHCLVKRCSGNWACSSLGKEMAPGWPSSSLPTPLRRLQRVWKTTGTDWNKTGPGVIQGKGFHDEVRQALQQAAQRGCAVSIPAGFQDTSDEALNSLARPHWGPCFEQEVGLEILEVPFSLIYTMTKSRGALIRPNKTSGGKDERETCNYSGINWWHIRLELQHCANAESPPQLKGGACGTMSLLVTVEAHR